MPKGGPCVINTSVSFGIKFQCFFISSPRSRLKAQLLNHGVMGEPHNLKPSISQPESFRYITPLGIICSIIRGCACSKKTAWLPAMNTLCLYFSLLNQSNKSSVSSGCPRLLTSPAWMSKSPFGNFSERCWPWVSEITTVFISLPDTELPENRSQNILIHIYITGDAGDMAERSANMLGEQVTG